ncbi:uncharacterized protein LOC130051433 [Ostrea edulis]|uniref:uncharacterized protein LOC130051433 n=1 Tax=Ostrea edulis TaxID=37623 RepID=UPI0024AF2DEC|nr:uncharacterized protein LOC130051433 [Ostrea edulis]
MYENARSSLRVGDGLTDEFEVKVGVHQGSVLSPLLFIIVLEALSCEFRAGVPWEDLYADDLVIISNSLEECVRRLLTWKEAMERKGLRVNAKKIMICGTGLDLLQSSGEFPCAVCRTGVGSNSIHCKGYGRPQKEVQVGTDKLEVVVSFCYLGDMLSAAGGCVLSTITHVKTAWNKFRELLPVLSSRHLSYKTCGSLYSTYVRSAMLYASETWPLPKPDLLRLRRNDRAMVRQICRVKPEDMASVRSSELLARLGIDDLDAILREKRLRWFGHVARSSGAINNVFNMKKEGG